MLDGGLKKKARQNKARGAQLSAVILLQSYLEAHPSNETTENL
jgi:RNase H-fold protein (predicted Holliday junction resolvase)